MSGTSKAKGRLSNHLKPLGQIELAATLATLRYLRDEKRMSAREMCEGLSNFRSIHEGPIHDETREDNDGLPHFFPDETTVRRGLKKNRVSDPIALGLNLWLKTAFSHLYQRHLHDELIRSEEVFVRTTRVVLGGDGALKLGRIRQLEGQYRLIRPHHLDPGRSAIMELFTIGGTTSPYECSLVSKFDNEYGRPSGTTVTGRIVPHSNRLIALMGNATKAQIVIHFDSLEVDDHTNTTSALRGIMIASVGNLPSSAYPLQCVRVEPGEPFKPHVLSADEVGRLPKSAREALTRGSVAWRREDYRAFGRKR